MVFIYKAADIKAPESLVYIPLFYPLLFYSQLEDFFHLDRHEIYIPYSW